MFCYDCHAQNGVETQASATCSVCGAGLCADHVVEGFAEETAKVSLGNNVSRRIHGRRLFCRQCAPAHMIADRQMAS